MKRLVLALGLAAVLLGPSACRKQTSDSAAIRSGILQHLQAIGNLNMSAMDMDVKSVSINGNQAHAEVEFRPKTGSVPPGAGMQVAYNLEKREGSWVVLKTQPLGGTIQHPDPNQNPHANSEVHSQLPKFSDILNPADRPAPAAPPAGHPQVASPPPSSKSSSTNPELP